MSKEFHYAYSKVKDKRRCVKCGLFLCICQLSLRDYVRTKVFIPNMDPKSNCPGNCDNQNKLCFDCFMFDKFKGVGYV